MLWRKHAMTSEISYVDNNYNTLPPTRFRNFRVTLSVFLQHMMEQSDAFFSVLKFKIRFLPNN
jgi:hypothetical protein